ncbi:MAG: hypothetical protein C4519_16430 [Desulfobacteraceae bacterium]|nr:MAG: hypothetical protein C4519_16430 [Desulfobacteraceae bacterium]
MVSFGVLSVLLLLGVFLRAWLGFFQKLLFPASLIGGIAGLVLANTGILPLDKDMIQAFAYHLFNISFISVGLTPTEFQPKTGSKESAILKGSLWMAALQAVTFSLQALVGGIFVLLFVGIGWELFPTFGFLLPLAFNEGPGQALSIGKSWEAFGFAEASTIGLTLASLGFFFAFFVGVPLANRGIKRENTAKRPPAAFLGTAFCPRAKSGRAPAALPPTAPTSNAWPFTSPRSASSTC